MPCMDRGALLAVLKASMDAVMLIKDEAGGIFNPRLLPYIVPLTFPTTRR